MKKSNSSKIVDERWTEIAHQIIDKSVNIKDIWSQHSDYILSIRNVCDKEDIYVLIALYSRYASHLRLVKDKQALKYIDKAIDIANCKRGAFEREEFKDILESLYDIKAVSIHQFGTIKEEFRFMSYCARNHGHSKYVSKMLSLGQMVFGPYYIRALLFLFIPLFVSLLGCIFKGGMFHLYFGLSIVAIILCTVLWKEIVFWYLLRYSKKKYNKKY